MIPTSVPTLIFSLCWSGRTSLQSRTSTEDVFPVLLSLSGVCLQRISVPCSLIQASCIWSYHCLINTPFLSFSLLVFGNLSSFSFSFLNKLLALASLEHPPFGYLDDCVLLSTIRKLCYNLKYVYGSYHSSAYCSADGYIVGAPQGSQGTLTDLAKGCVTGCAQDTFTRCKRNVRKW